MLTDYTPRETNPPTHLSASIDLGNEIWYCDREASGCEYSTLLYPTHMLQASSKTFTCLMQGLALYHVILRHYHVAGHLCEYYSNSPNRNSIPRSAPLLLDPCNIEFTRVRSSVSVSIAIVARQWFFLWNKRGGHSLNYFMFNFSGLI